MNLFEAEKQEEYEALGFKNQRRSVKVSTHRTGKTNVKRDIKRQALAPGKRISKAGNVYYESRRNRSDIVGKKL